jgi:hypothetical protein
VIKACTKEVLRRRGESSVLLSDLQYRQLLLRLCSAPDFGGGAAEDEQRSG